MEKMIESKLNTMNIILVVIASCLVITLIMNISDRIKISNAINKATTAVSAKQIQSSWKEVEQQNSSNKINFQDYKHKKGQDIFEKRYKSKELTRKDY